MKVNTPLNADTDILEKRPEIEMESPDARRPFRENSDHFVSFLSRHTAAKYLRTDRGSGGVFREAAGEMDGNDTARSGSGALNANEYDGRVNVNRNRAENLANAYDNEGGRLAELVQNSADAPAVGRFLLWIKADFCPCIFSPYAEHAPDFLEFRLPIDVALQ